MLTKQSLRFLARAGVLLLGAFCSDAFGAPEIGRPAPALIAKQLDGRDLDLDALHGKVVVLNYWATWCPPCRAEMPALDAFYQHHRDEGVEVIGLSADDPHDRKDVVKVMRAITYPAILASEAKVNGFGAATALPITYVIDQDGILRAILRPGKSVITENALAEAVRPLLNKDHDVKPQ